VPLPLTVAVPTVLPPLVQLLGAVACGPNTVKVIVPVAPLLAPDKVELIELAVIACPAVPDAGAATLVLVALVAVVLVIALPQAELEGALVASPL
jgi:hypothetical protein